MGWVGGVGTAGDVAPFVSAGYPSGTSYASVVLLPVISLWPVLSCVKIQNDMLRQCQHVSL